MTKMTDLHQMWMKDAKYRREYEALEEEFAAIAASAQQRRDTDSANSKRHGR